MEEKNQTVQTSTTTVKTNVEETNIGKTDDVKVNETPTEKTEEEKVIKELKTVHPAIVIMFGEFLGYVSSLIDYAEKICKGEKLDDEINKLIETEAIFIFKKMQTEYTLEDLRAWYDEFHEVYFKEYEDNINNKKTTPIVQTTTNSYPSRFNDYEDWD